MPSQYRIDYISYLATLPHAPDDSVRPIPAPLDEALGLVAPDEHGLDRIFPTVLCGFVRFKNGNPIHHDWLALEEHGNDAKFYKNTPVSMMHQGVLAELMWQAEMQEESMAVLQRSPSACEYVIALELPVGEVFEDMEDIKRVAFEEELGYETDLKYLPLPK